MTRYVALLRAVNLGPHQRVPMAQLREALADAGFDDVVTYLQSGNAVFSADDVSRDQVRKLIADRLGVDCDVLLRTGDDLAEVVRDNPWPERASAPTQLNVAFLDDEPASGTAPKHVAEDEEFVVRGREVYLWYGHGVGRSKLSLAPFGTTTVRNWRTVTALAEMSA